MSGEEVLPPVDKIGRLMEEKPPTRKEMVASLLRACLDAYEDPVTGESGRAVLVGVFVFLPLWAIPPSRRFFERLADASQARCIVAELAQLVVEAFETYPIPDEPGGPVPKVVISEDGVTLEIP